MSFWKKLFGEKSNEQKPAASKPPARTESVSVTPTHETDSSKVKSENIDLQKSAIPNEDGKSHDSVSVDPIVYEWLRRYYNFDGIIPSIQKLSQALIEARGEGNPSLIRGLISLGADPNYKIEGGNSAMILSIRIGDLEVIKAMVEGGGDLSITDTEGFSPLTSAAFNGQFEVVKYLLSKGADKNHKSKNGKTPLDWAKGQRHFEVLKLLEEPQNLTYATSVIAAQNNDFSNVKVHLVDDILYPSVKIGNQIWMTDNLNVDHFRNGDPISEAISTWVWSEAGDDKKPAWCYYDKDPANGRIYGKLYNWYAVNDPRGLAPEGWHVPSDNEWEVLADYLCDGVGGKMKSTGTQYWNSPNKDASNSSGFSGLPGGYRVKNGVFNNIGFNGYWWSSSENTPNEAWFRSLQFHNGNMLRSNYYVNGGLSVRCLMD